MATEAISSNPVLRLGRHVTWILVLATLLGFALVDQNVLTARNLRNILIQTSYTTIFACAQMFVILVRGFDLSLGAGVSLISVVVALVTTAVLGDGSAGLAVAAGIGAALAAGFALGLFNGACTAWLGVNPFVVTLGSMNIAFVYGDKRIVTPALTGSILPGITRDSVLKLAPDLGYTIEEGRLEISDVMRDALLAYLASAPTGTASAWSLGADLFGRHAGPADLATARRQHLGDAWGDKHARRSAH